MSALRQAVKFESADYPLRRQYLVIYADERIYMAVPLVSKFVRAAFARLPFVDSHLHPVRTDPSNVEVRIGMCLEKQFARSVELADDKKFLFAGFGRNCSSV